MKEENKNKVEKQKKIKTDNNEDLINKTKRSKRIRRRIVMIVLLTTLIISYVIIRGNYLEMMELGSQYISVFWINVIYTSLIYVANFLFIFLSFYLTNRKIQKALQVFFDDEKKEMPKFPNKSISFVIALLGSVIITSILKNQLLLGLSGSQFGISDPVFNVDIGFMMFQKPLIQILIVYFLVVVVATLAYSLLFSIIVLNVSFEGVSRESITKVKLIDKVGSRVKIIAVLVALLIVFFMVSNIGNEKFMGIELNDGTSYSLYGAGKADATIKLGGYVLLAILAMVSILNGYKNIKKGRVRAVVGDALIVPIYLIALAIVLAGYQMIFIGNETLASNNYYIQSNINSTKQAYDINTQNSTIDYGGTITEYQINNNINLLSNIDIATKANVLQDFQTSTSSKGYYSYRNTQVGQYNLNGIETLVYVTPREISNNNTTYFSKTYQYTHGYGSIITLAGATDENGYLKHIQHELGDLSHSPIKITQPRVYYGLEANNNAVIHSKETEIDYINEDTNQEVNKNYEGNAGLKLGFLDRLILGIKEGDVQLAFSGLLTSESSILINRNVVERAKSVLPFIKYESNPYMVIDDSGNQYWVIDGYTTSNYYPFSQKTNITDIQEINYIRNSIKVIVNAYDGTMKFYITDRNDPIAMAYNNVYPTLFEKPEKTIPEDISKHFVYPETLYNIQSRLVEEYHDIKSEVLYRGNDIWEIAQIGANRTDKIKPYYTMVKGSNNEEKMGLIVPYTPYGKQNLSAYLVGSYENGKPVLRINIFSSENNVLGPIQIQTQIDQDERIATEIASLNTTGTRITKRLIAVPVEDTIVYVETIYQQLINETKQKPTLKKVVVASGNKISIGNNLEAALNNLLSQYAVDIDVTNTDDMLDLVNSVIKANENVKNSSKSTDWKLFGEDMQTLTSLIDQLQKVVEEQEKNMIDSEKNSVNTNAVQEEGTTSSIDN